MLHALPASKTPNPPQGEGSEAGNDLVFDLLAEPNTDVWPVQKEPEQTKFHPVPDTKAPEGDDWALDEESSDGWSDPQSDSADEPCNPGEPADAWDLES